HAGREYPAGRHERRQCRAPGTGCAGQRRSLRRRRLGRAGWHTRRRQTGARQTRSADDCAARRWGSPCGRLRRADSCAMTAPAYADALEPHRRHLWGLCYRMTGNAADADELVQETFARALERPPARTDQPWRPWLVRVAMNLARDLLRYRRRSPYRGSWLPSPIETDSDDELPSYELAVGSGSPTEGRYELLESVSFAFLLALEALRPNQRAVLLLRDVFDY